MKTNKMNSTITMWFFTWVSIRDRGSLMLKFKAKTSKTLEYLMRMVINLEINAFGTIRRKDIAFRLDSILITS